MTKLSWFLSFFLSLERHRGLHTTQTRSSSHTRVLRGVEMQELLTSPEMEVSSVPSARHKRRPGPLSMSSSFL